MGQKPTAVKRAIPRPSHCFARLGECLVDLRIIGNVQGISTASALNPTQRQNFNPGLSFSFWLGKGPRSAPFAVQLAAAIAGGDRKFAATPTMEYALPDGEIHGLFPVYWATCCRGLVDGYRVGKTAASEQADEYSQLRARPKTPRLPPLFLRLCPLAE